MKQLILCKGLPASGKSTFAKEWVNEDPTTRVRVNRDDIRRMLGPYWVPNRENLVTRLENRAVTESLLNGYSVILDATNFKSEKWISKAAYYGVELIIKDFTDVPLNICIERDKTRGVESVGEAVIRGMYDKYLKK